MADISEAIRKKKLLIIAGLMSLMLGLGMVPVGGSMGVQQVSASCDGVNGGTGGEEEHRDVDTEDPDNPPPPQFDDCEAWAEFMSNLPDNDLYNECKIYHPDWWCADKIGEYQDELKDYYFCICMQYDDCEEPDEPTFPDPNGPPRQSYDPPMHET